MTRKEALRQAHQQDALCKLGFSPGQADALRRISMTLHRWHERECGLDHGCIERDDTTNKPYWLDSCTMSRTPIRDDEAGALGRLAAIIKSVNVARAGKVKPLSYYIQGDPRGAALYIIRPGDVPDGCDVNSYYNRGLCVY